MPNVTTTLSKLFCLFLTLSLSVLAISVQAQVDEHQVHTNTLGPFTIGKDHQLTVYARITHVHLQKDEADGWPDSDTLLVVVDGNGRTLYRQSAYTTLGGAETEFGCSLEYIPTVGNVLMCTESVSPTVATDGETVRLFGVNSKRKFVPLTARINRFDYKIVFLDSRTRRRPIVVDSSLAYAKPAFEVENWAGYYEVKLYRPIYPEGFSRGRDPILYHFDEIPVDIDSNEVRGQQGNRRGDVRVSLYPTAGASASQVENIMVKPNSQIKYLYASYVHDWWLFVSVDGQKGFVTRSDCPKLGFDETDGTPIMLGDDY